ncbi:hypothetical protein [Williamsoniiplasma luminosum]|nr:hypothetical protein [Williamsoniiplasma luminosum]
MCIYIVLSNISATSKFLLYDFKYINFVFTALSSIFTFIILGKLIKIFRALYKKQVKKEIIKISKLGFFALFIWIVTLIAQMTFAGFFIHLKLNTLDIFIKAMLDQNVVWNYLLILSSFIAFFLAICFVAILISIFLLTKIYKVLLIQNEEISSFTLFFQKLTTKQHVVIELKHVVVEIVFLFLVYNKTQKLKINSIISNQLKIQKKGTTPPLLTL